MCVCAPPVLWPVLLLALLVAALTALAATGLLHMIVTAVFVGVGGAVAIRIVAAVIGNALERRSDRRWNAAVAAAMAKRRQIPNRTHVDITVVEKDQAALTAARPALPPSVQVYATPQKELTRGVPR